MVTNLRYTTGDNKNFRPALNEVVELTMARAGDFDENQVIESIKGLIEALQKYDADVLKHEKVQSEIVDLKEAFNSKDIPLSTCVVDEPPSHWEFFGLDDVGFNVDLEVDFGEE